MRVARRIDTRLVPGPAQWRAHAAGLACLLLAFMLQGWAGLAQGADHFSVEARAQDGAVVIQVQMHLRARHPVIWATLTDYDQMAHFVPGIKYSRVIERRGSTAVVEQKGAAEILFFSYPIEVTVESLESAPEAISVRVLKGNLKRLEGGYRLEKVEGRENEFVLTWRGLIEPAFAVPSFITVPLMRATLERQFLAMVQEIERREALAPPAGTAAARLETPAANTILMCDSSNFRRFVRGPHADG